MTKYLPFRSDATEDFIKRVAIHFKDSVEWVDDIDQPEFLYHGE